MNHIIRFNQFKINEALGIADATLFYVDLIKSNSLIEILDIMNSNLKLNNKVEKIITIPYTSIKGFVTNWELYKKFPVSKITINLSVEKKETIDDLHWASLVFTDEEKIIWNNHPFTIGAFTPGFARGNEKAAMRFLSPIKLNVDHSISLYMDIIFSYTTLFRMDKHESLMKIDLEATILHELNHSYEEYKRKLGGNSAISTTLSYASALSENRYGRPKKLYQYWQKEFLYYLYVCSSHEINAYIQEAKPYIYKMNFESYKKTQNWIIVDEMRNFDYKNFIKNFNKIISEHNPEYVDKFINILIKDFIRDYKKESLEVGENNDRLISRLERMSTKQFFEYWEKRIKDAGDIIARNILRIYSHKYLRGKGLLDKR